MIALPVPGEPARMPFWKGDAPGRPLELGRALGAFVRELSGAGSDAARNRIEAAGLDAWAADNLLSYLHEQREATGHVPDDRTVVVERFRDELGDWRMVVHSPFGAQVNGPWALAIGARLRERRGVEAQVASADDGIVLRLPDALDADGAEVLPTAEDVLLDPDEVEQLVVAEVGGSALFASRFRECAARSLLLPRRDPRRRTPLWQQRQRSAQLLTVASKYEQFPVVLEAMRECLQDVYDLPGLRELMSEVRARRVRVVEIATPSPSPFARSLLFGYVGMFLYELDAPLAERKAAALALDSTLLAELLGSEAIRELLDPAVLVELRGTAAAHRPRPPRPGRREHRRLVARAGRSHRGRGRAARGRPTVARRARLGPSGDCRADLRRGPLDRDRGRRAGARRAGRGPTGRSSRGIHRAGGRPARGSSAALCQNTRAVYRNRSSSSLRTRGRRGGRGLGSDDQDQHPGAGRAASR